MSIQRRTSTARLAKDVSDIAALIAFPLAMFYETCNCTKD